MKDKIPNKIFIQIPSRRQILASWSEQPIDSKNLPEFSNIEYVRKERVLEFIRQLYSGFGHSMLDKDMEWFNNFMNNE